MLILDRSIVMIGLGSLGHPVLRDGVHLRWQARRELGFPWYGYGLYRRPHRAGRFLCLSTDLAGKGPGPVHSRWLALPRGTVSSDAPLVLTAAFAPAGAAEVDLARGSYVQVACPEDVRRVRVTLGFRASGSVTVDVLLDGTVLQTLEVEGRAGDVVHREYACDLITSVRLHAGPASLIDLCYVPVSQDATAGWQPIAGCPYPLGLPVTHPNYPGTGWLPENPAASQATAMSRLRFPLPPTGAAAYPELYGRLIELVQGGPGGPAMAGISSTYVGVPDAGDPDPPPTMPALYPLDMVLLGALHPAIAQMVGLYWLDDTALASATYDYLLVGSFAKGAAISGDVRHLLGSESTRLYGYIVFAQRPHRPPDLAAPARVDAFALPGLSLQRSDGTWVNAFNNAGLRWDRGTDPAGTLLPDRALLYHVFRADCGSGASPTVPAPADYRLVRDQPVVIPGDHPVSAAAQWPSGWPQLPMYTVDRDRPDGWYSYRVAGQDLFGRQSPLSPACRWLAADGTTVRNPLAVQLADATPPPVPQAVRALALQADYRLVPQDAAFHTWQAALTDPESLIGLRVSWQWPERYEQQAPDTKDFRIYYEPGWLNARAGRTLTVAVSGSSSTVATDIEHSEAADAFAGCRLRIRNAFYAITASSAASPLTLTVTNLAGGEETTPAALAPGTVVIPPGHALHADYRTAAPWDTLLATVACVPGQRTYELLWPEVDGAGLPLAPDTATPVVYANIAVSAVDSHGNESTLSAPARIFAVHRTPPAAPAAAWDDTTLYATRADYLSRSFYTHRWPWSPNLFYHVLRALDQTVCQVDWTIRSAGGRTALTGAESDCFPAAADEPAWTAERRAAAAAAINAIAARADYAGLSDDALRIIAGLSGSERAFQQLTVDPLDPADSANVDAADPGLLAYTDTLDGRSQNRYLYRVLAVDGAQNRSDLSLAGPPVHLHDVVPPRAPVLTRILGDEGKVVLRWAANREADLSEYRVYRAESEAETRDVRLMSRLALTVAGTAAVGGSVTCDDATAIPGHTYYYRVVAVDTAGNVSPPSATLAGRAIDTSPPDPPAFTAGAWAETGGTLGIHLEWEAGREGARALVQRREATGTDWSGISTWLTATSYDDSSASPDTSYVYRLRVKSAAGLLNTTYAETSVTALFTRS